MHRSQKFIVLLGRCRVSILKCRHRHLPKVIKKMKDKEENRKKQDKKEFNVME
jgi:hypothetical protein